MNRSILIVICDFLLVSLLAFSAVDSEKLNDAGTAQTSKLEAQTNQVDGGKDLAAVMRLALEEERKGRDQLMGELAKTRDALGKQQALLGEREKEVQNYQQKLSTREQESQALQQAQTNLQQQFGAAQAHLRDLAQQLQTSTNEATMTKEMLTEVQTEMRKQAEQASALQQQLAMLARSNQMVLAERQQLATQLQVAQAEKRAAADQVAQMQEQVKVERQEKAQLVQSVSTLASKSKELAQEIRDNRPLAPNTIFSDFLSNRVEARFAASRAGLFGEKRRETETILVTDGTNTYALCHLQETPISLWNPGTDWEKITGTLNRQATVVPIHALSFSLPDPRVVFMPVTATEAQQLGCKVYRTSTDPFKFQDAVLVGAKEGYYGECKFQIDLSTPDYVKLDHSVIKGIFGKFNPSRGDLVFSKTGELLGIMANGTYCMMLRNFDYSNSFHFGEDLRAQRTGDTLTRLYTKVFEMPFKLQ